MVCRVAVVAGLLAAAPAFAQVAAPKTAPPPSSRSRRSACSSIPPNSRHPISKKKDEDACYDWAEANTGLTLMAGSVDAEAAGKAAAKDAGQGKVAGGAAAGAATGLAIGAIAGDAARAQRSAPWQARLAAYVRVRRASRRLARRVLSRPSRRTNRQWTSSGKRRAPVSRRGVSSDDWLRSSRLPHQDDRRVRARALHLRIGADPQQWPGIPDEEQRDRMTPGQVLDALRQGNERFRTGKIASRDYRDQQRTTAAGQFPAAVVLGCIDSRAPAEIIFDTGIGDTFNARIAGNVVNDDLLGSLEFACAVAGAKVLLLFGHTACGAIKGAIDDVELGNLTGLLARVKPAITATAFEGAKSSKSSAYVDAVARTNVLLGLDNIRRRSPILAELEKKSAIQIAGGMYDLVTGAVEFVTEG